MTPTEALVVGNLRHGACTIESLARLCGVSRRDIEEAVETLRLDGEPIVAGPYGLRLTDDPEELSAYVKGRRDSGDRSLDPPGRWDPPQELSADSGRPWIGCDSATLTLRCGATDRQPALSWL
jgi:biotin operon repressor